MKKWMFTGTICIVLLTACDKEDNDMPNATDTDFAAMASISNNAEIQAGQLAATKGTNSMVKAFAQLMVTEHTTAQEDLRNRAATVNIIASDTVDAAHLALMTRLNSLSGYSFDTAYMNSQVKDHAATLNLFNTEINSGNNETVRNYATTYLPHIQMHYNKADSIRKAL